MFIVHTLKMESGVQCCFEPNVIQNIETNIIQKHIWYSKTKTMCSTERVLNANNSKWEKKKIAWLWIFYIFFFLSKDPL